MPPAGVKNSISAEPEKIPEKVPEKVPEKQAAPPPYTSSSNENQEYAVAMYNYKPQQPDDMELREGDKILVTEKLSPSWWKGNCGSKSGIFPSNYVRVLGENEKGSQMMAAPQQQQQIQPQQQQPVYQQPVYQQPAYQQPSQPPAQMVPQQQEQPQQQEGQSSGMMHKFGSKMGNAVIWGAGATIGNDIVNSIF